MKYTFPLQSTGKSALHVYCGFMNYWFQSGRLCLVRFILQAIKLKCLLFGISGACLALAAEIFIKLVQAMESYYFGFSTSRPWLRISFKLFGDGWHSATWGLHNLHFNVFIELDALPDSCSEESDSDLSDVAEVDSEIEQEAQVRCR